ncbi:MAG: ATP-binding protein [Anaerolineae bacterium]
MTNPGPAPAGEPVVIRVKEEHHIACARQTAAAVAAEMGFKRVLVAYIATSVSELASNLFFHTDGGGTISLLPLRQGNKIGLEVIAADDGPGIPNIDLAMQDGHSTGGGLGSGLPGVRRLMDEFRITSTAGAGTRVIVRKWQLCR